MVTSLTFVGNSPDDLTAGCQPFLVVYTTQHHHYCALDEDAMVANQLDQGTTSASLVDIRKIREKERVKVPQDLNQQVCLTICQYAILVHKCMSLLLANNFHEQVPHFLGQHQGLAGTPWENVYAAHILCHIHINVVEHLQSLQAIDGAGGGG